MVSTLLLHVSIHTRAFPSSTHDWRTYVMSIDSMIHSFSGRLDLLNFPPAIGQVKRTCLANSIWSIHSLAQFYLAAIINFSANSDHLQIYLMTLKKKSRLDRALYWIDLVCIRFEENESIPLLFQDLALIINIKDKGIGPLSNVIYIDCFQKASNLAEQMNRLKAYLFFESPKDASSCMVLEVMVELLPLQRLIVVRMVKGERSLYRMDFPF